MSAETMSDNPANESPVAAFIDAAQDWIQQSLLEQVDRMIASRREHWEESAAPLPTLDDITDLIRTAALKNASISGAATAVPGPIGVATIPAELLLSMQTTVGLVYDIALAHGAADRVDSAVMLTVVARDKTLLGKLLVSDEEGQVVKRPGRQVLGKVMQLLGKQAVKRVARVFLGRMVPFLGAAGAAWWARSATLSLGRRASRLFEKEFTVVDATSAEDEDLERIVQEMVAPDELDESPPVLEARYHLFVDLVNASEEISADQKAKLDAMHASYLSKGCTLDEPARLLTHDRVPLNLAVLAGDDPEELFADLAVFGGLGEGVPRAWAHELGAAFGLDAGHVDEMVADDTHPHAVRLGA